MRLIGLVVLAVLMIAAYAQEEDKVLTVAKEFGLPEYRTRLWLDEHSAKLVLAKLEEIKTALTEEPNEWTVPTPGEVRDVLAHTRFGETVLLARRALSCNQPPIIRFCVLTELAQLSWSRLCVIAVLRKFKAKACSLFSALFDCQRSNSKSKPPEQPWRHLRVRLFGLLLDSGLVPPKGKGFCKGDIPFDRWLTGRVLPVALRKTSLLNIERNILPFETMSVCSREWLLEQIKRFRAMGTPTNYQWVPPNRRDAMRPLPYMLFCEMIRRFKDPELARVFVTRLFQTGKPSRIKYTSCEVTEFAVLFGRALYRPLLKGLGSGEVPKDFRAALLASARLKPTPQQLQFLLGVLADFEPKPVQLIGNGTYRQLLVAICKSLACWGVDKQLPACWRKRLLIYKMLTGSAPVNKQTLSEALNNYAQDPHTARLVLVLAQRNCPPEAKDVVLTWSRKLLEQVNNTKLPSWLLQEISGVVATHLPPEDALKLLLRIKSDTWHALVRILTKNPDLINSLPQKMLSSKVLSAQLVPGLPLVADSSLALRFPLLSLRVLRSRPSERLAASLKKSSEFWPYHLLHLFWVPFEREQVRALLDSSHDAARVYAAYAVAFNSRLPATTLLPLLDDKNPDVRWQAYIALLHKVRSSVFLAGYHPDLPPNPRRLIVRNGLKSMLATFDRLWQQHGNTLWQLYQSPQHKHDE